MSHSIMFWLAVGVAVLLLVAKPRLIKAIAKADPRQVRPDKDNILSTFWTLLLTLLSAAPLALILAAVGGQARGGLGGTDLTHAMGSSLLYVALHLYILRALRMMCIPDGLALAHFGWDDASVIKLRTKLDRLTWIFVLSVLFTRLAVDLNPTESGGTVALLGFLAYVAVTVVFILRVFNPQRGVIPVWRVKGDKTWLQRVLPILWLALMIIPLVLAILALTGYVYSASILQILYQQTLWLITGLVVMVAFVSRAILVTERRLAYKAALEKRKAAIEARKAELAQEGEEDDPSLHIEEPEVDLAALSDDSRELLKVATVFVGVFSLSALWSPVLPALSILNDITLWHRVVTVDGEIERIPLTLAGLGLAMIYAVATSVLTRRLPGMVEIALLRGGVSSGGRYTATTLTRYAVIAVGVWLVFNTLGARWAQFQWLVAALGVGIGFGLQEIVANFISGLIMLFERPLRIGDVVTVGDTTGMVTRIQIRATTILDWDHKELVVPNREFITGRLLNWTLSDRVIRTVMEVGVAYGTDIELAMGLLKEVAEDNERVLDDPAPVVSFERFSDSAITISLRAWVSSIDYRLSTTTALNKAVNRKFAEAGIVIAFPQRHIHVETHDPMRVSVDEVRKTNSPKEGP